MAIFHHPSQVVAAVITAGVLGVASSGPLAAQPTTPPPPSNAQPQPKSRDPFFDDTVLHEIRLTINSRDWQSLKDHYLDNTYYPCDLKWHDQTVRNIGLRSRGNGSRSGIKPGLRIDFDRYTTNQKFLGLKSFVLRNNTQDSTNMHERLSMLLFRRMGVPASKEAHTRLYVNNLYVGLYTIVESVDKTFLKDRFGEDEGYLYKYDYPPDAQPYYFENRGTNPDTYVPLPFKPETHESDPHAEIVERLVWTINETNDAVFRTALEEFLDVKKFIKHIAVEIFLGDGDGFLGNWAMNNFYFYRFENKHLFTLIAWDKSLAFHDGYRYSIFHNLTDNDPRQRNRLMTRLLSYADLKQFYLDSLMDVVRSANEVEAGKADGAGWLEREVQREYLQIRDAARADSDKPYSNEAFEQGIADLDLFARRRGKFVEDEVWAARGRL